MSLDEMQRIKRWHVAHRLDRPLEYHVWDAMLTLWVVGCVGWLPASALQQLWAIPVCLLAMGAPGLYAAWRHKAHRQHSVRCDWLPT